MTPEAAAKLQPGERVYFQPDMLVPKPRAGIYTVLAVQSTTVAGRMSARIKISDNPEIWARHGNLGRVSREQQERTFE